MPRCGLAAYVAENFASDLRMPDLAPMCTSVFEPFRTSSIAIAVNHRSRP